MSSSDNIGLRHATSETEYNALRFVITQMLSKVRTIELVKVVAVTNDREDVEPVGFVDVVPMVHQMSGKSEPTEHRTIHNLPYFRLQGGTDAIIIDPHVGDIGLAGFCDRDISVVKKTRDVANPGSWRQMDMADGLYIGGFLNGMPRQYVRFVSDDNPETDDGMIEIYSPNLVRIRAEQIKLNPSVVTGSQS